MQDLGNTFWNAGCSVTARPTDSPNGGSVSIELTEPRNGRRFVGEATPSTVYGWRVVVGRVPFLLSEHEAAIFKLREAPENETTGINKIGGTA